MENNNNNRYAASARDKLGKVYLSQPRPRNSVNTNINNNKPVQNKVNFKEPVYTSPGFKAGQNPKKTVMPITNKPVNKTVMPIVNKPDNKKQAQEISNTLKQRAMIKKNIGNNTDNGNTGSSLNNQTLRDRLGKVYLPTPVKPRIKTEIR